ncbi:polymorphic toxin-type HINT domain-containing protein [Paenibacillus apiarius]|uniref:polymorphic toxin-type HINT domain-containing protein n=1 Tax=Paenibacillus apiarius TaxID=46240 RepID=UPI003B3A9718
MPDIQGASYTYDSRNRLTQVKIEKGKTVSYRYNGDGVMVERSEDDVTTRYYYDDRALIVAEGTVNPDGTVALTAAYVHDASGKLLARQVPGQSGLQYYFTNGHGDVTEIRDAQGNLLNRYTYDIWGNPLTEEEQVPNMFRYSGEYWDKTTNLQYLRARWYDPSIGRFINEDTYEGNIKNPLSLNLYTYVYSNPLIHADPTGNFVYPVSPALTCAVDITNCGANLNAQVEASKTLAVEGANFLILDDINTMLNPDGSFNEKAFTTASFLPWGKVLKAAKVGTKVKKAMEALAKCNCFTAGTKVLTDEGEKPIEEIEVGDKVLAKDDETGKMAYKEVEWLFQRDVEETYNITVGGEVITTTDEHPFWIVGKGWVEAQHLVVGDVLTTLDGKELAIEKIEVKQEHMTVYNFKVKDFHTYFVSNLGVWTHNSCGITGSQLANFARKSKKIDGLQGVKASADVVNQAAVDFVGKGAKVQKIDGGMWYVSADGLRRVRTGQKSKGAYEANFEIFNKKGFNEKNKKSNYHVEIE